MGKTYWLGHSHDYMKVVVEGSQQVFEASRCAGCGEHKFVTRLKKFLTRKK